MKRPATRKKIPARSFGKHPGGRPTNYRPEYCEQIVAYRQDGWSKSAFAAKVGTSLDAIQDWEKAHPEFARAVKDSHVACERWWEERGRTALNERYFNVGVFAILTRNICKWSDRERIIVEKAPMGTLLSDAERAYVAERDKGIDPDA